MNLSLRLLQGLALLLGVGSGLITLSTDNPGTEARPTPPVAQLRRPSAAVLLDDMTLCVANQRSGTLALVDLDRKQVRTEVAVGQHLSGLALMPDGKHLLVLDDERHELLAVSRVADELTVRARLAVGPYPVSVIVHPDGKRATVASLWSRRLEVVDLSTLAERGTLRVQHTVPLPFAAREQCLLPDRTQVVVAAAFGGGLAVVEVTTGRLVAVHEVKGHNLRGLAVRGDGSELLVSQQLLDQQLATTQTNLTRGLLMTNGVRMISLRALARNDATGRLFAIGDIGHGAGDPAGLAVLHDGRCVVALAGVNEVAILDRDGKTTRRVPVGRHPTVVVACGKGQPVVVVNTFDDSLSLVDPDKGTVGTPISLGTQPKLSHKDEGEILFHDARLARDGWMSCHSCHTDGHSNGLLADTFGDGSFGTPKRTLTLLNTRMTDPWGWNGGMQYLHDQVNKSLEETMHTPQITAAHIANLTAFLHTLPPPPPTQPLTSDAADRQQIERGRRQFEERRCVLCHIAPLTYSSNGAHDVGLADERGLREFNPPSLRGVSQGNRFFHDNRAASLEEVFTRYHHKVEADISRDELADLLRFLHSL